MTSAGGLTVAVIGERLTAARDKVLDAAVARGLAGALVAKNTELWGANASDEAAIRLGWLDLPRSSRDLLPRLAALRAELLSEGIDRVVLAGMGGSSLAPEVICASAGVPLTVLDTTDPGQVRAALIELPRTVVVVSSKSGGTVETDSHRRAFAQAFTDAGLEPGRHLIAVTDPGSELEQTARDSGFREVFLADPNVGGRYSALTAFGLVPSALAGADVTALLDTATELSEGLGRVAGNPALTLGAVLAGAAKGGRDKVVLTDAGSPIAGFGDWAEQLIAESTGKEGTGLLPVVIESPDSPGAAPGLDVHLVRLRAAGDEPQTGDEHTSISGPLGAQFLGWEYATAVAGWALRINPFDQPNVTESKENTARILESGLSEESPALVDGAVEIYADRALLGGATDLLGVLTALLDSIPERGYLAVMAFLDRHADNSAAGLRDALAARTDRPVTFGWGPRFLHSTGQFHKGGPQVGAFLQVTGTVTQDLPIPGRAYSFGTLQAAQAAGDREALIGRSRPLVRLHLTDRAAGMGRLLEAVR